VQNQGGFISVQSSLVNLIISPVRQISINSNTRFLSVLVEQNKVYRISAVIRINNKKISLVKSQVQADQGFDMNVIFPAMIRQYKLDFHLLSKVRFADMSMKTADHRKTLLHHWIWLKIEIKGIWKTIRYFVAPEVPSSN
jgi:hypothetical protein